MNGKIHFIKLSGFHGKLEFTHRTADFLKETEKTIKGVESFEGIDLKRERTIKKENLDVIKDLSAQKGIGIFEFNAVTLNTDNVEAIKEEMLQLLIDRIESVRREAVNLESQISDLQSQRITIVHEEKEGVDN